MIPYLLLLLLCPGTGTEADGSPLKTLFSATEKPPSLTSLLTPEGPLRASNLVVCGARSLSCHVHLLSPPLSALLGKFSSVSINVPKQWDNMSFPEGHKIVLGECNINWRCFCKLSWLTVCHCHMLCTDYGWLGFLDCYETDCDINSPHRTANTRSAGTAALPHTLRHFCPA
jgi:hypothetical protein